jgi:hypothetical protein
MLFNDTPTILRRDLGYVRRERERDTNSIGGIVLADQRRSDAGEEYDFEALEDLSPTLARLLRMKFQRV